MTTPAYLEHYRAVFEDFLRTRSAEPSWMTELRRSAFAILEEKRLPSRKVEAWKYLSLRSFASESFAPTASTETPLPGSAYEPIARLVCTNGVLDLGQSDLGQLDSSVVFRPLSEAWDQARPTIEAIFADLATGMDALVAAFLQGGAVLDVGREVELDRPIEFVRRTTSGGAFGSSLLVVHARRMSRASVVERLSGDVDAPYFSGGFTAFDLEDGANLDHVINQREGASAYRYAKTTAQLARDVTFRTFNASIGASLSRDDVELTIHGEGSHAVMDALYLGRGTQHLDHHTTVDHVAPHTTSDQLYKTVLDDKSHGVFCGTVIVRRDAQQIRAGQLNNNLLLTEDARIDTKPQLEIGADDVECGHGATIGQLDEEELFYLQTRGFSPARARMMRIKGYVSEVVQRIGDPRVREYLLADVRQLLDDRLSD